MSSFVKDPFSQIEREMSLLPTAENRPETQADGLDDLVASLELINQLEDTVQKSLSNYTTDILKSENAPTAATSAHFQPLNPAAQKIMRPTTPLTVKPAPAFTHKKKATSAQARPAASRASGASARRLPGAPTIGNARSAHFALYHSRSEAPILTRIIKKST
jgi:hypothetical protein